MYVAKPLGVSRKVNGKAALVRIFFDDDHPRDQLKLAVGVL